MQREEKKMADEKDAFGKKLTHIGLKLEFFEEELKEDALAEG